MVVAVRLALLLLLAAVTVTCYGAEETCYEYQPSFPGATWYPSISAAAAAHASYCAASESNFRSAFCRNISCCTLEGFSASVDSTSAYSDSLPEYQLHFSLTIGGTPESLNTGKHVSRQVTECPDDPCVEAMNLASDTVTAGNNALPTGQLCASDDGSGGSYSGGLYGKGCEVIKNGAGIESDSGHWYGQIKYTGQSCPGEEEPDPLQNSANCLTIAGVKHCVSKTKQSCGTIDGQRVCLDDVPEGSCTLLAGGGAVCDAESDDVPKDDMGDPLEPTSQVTNTTGGTGTSTPGTTKTYNYYSKSVVESSSTTVSGSDDGESDGGSDGGNEPGACAEGVDCEGEIPDDLEALDSFGEITQAFMDRVAESDLVASVASLGTSVPTGSCPDWDIEVFGEEISLSAPMCTIWGSVSGLLSAVMLIAWGLLAARIVLSA